jgi:hypothetical protein
MALAVMSGNIQKILFCEKYPIKTFSWVRFGCGFRACIAALQQCRGGCGGYNFGLPWSIT